MAAYQYDDFGNVVSTTLPWNDNGSGGSGIAKYSYDALGNVLVKQTPAMAANGDSLQYSYDPLGRLLSLVHNYTHPSSGSETLYALAYDKAATIDPTCPTTTNTFGRLLNRTDSFGTTWFQYDAFGRITEEIRVRTGSTKCNATTPNVNPHTLYTYSHNGNLLSIQYPYGRTATYTYGTGALTDRVSNVSVTTYNGSAWVTSANILSNVAWEPYGGLRGYQINHPASVNASGLEYFLGDNGSTPPAAGACPALPSSTTSDHTGRERAIWVSTGTWTAGAGAGDIEKRGYTWKGDQIVQEDSCLLGATVPHTVTYGYDQLLRVAGAARPTGNFATAGGAIGSRSYTYDGRGNRTGDTREDCSYTPTYGAAAHPDEETKQASACAGSILAHSYTYDQDGRAATKKWANDSSGNPAWQLTFNSGDSGSGSNGALDSVFKSISVNGAVYNYYYDALNRRRLKMYPAGPTDEYFYGLGSGLLVDQGNDSVTTVANHPDDNYVWLGGRPVLLVRGTLSTAWARQTDSNSVACPRNGDGTLCGIYFPVTDAIGKPVVMLDASRKVVGAADYDVFGQLNRVSLNKETAHPYPLENVTLADFTQPTGGTGNPNTGVNIRALYSMVDTASAATAYTFLKDGSTGVALTPNYGGPHAGQIWTPWKAPSAAAAGHVKAQFVSTAAGTQKGIVMEAYEYQRYQTGSTPFWTPIRFPGQYYDGESDLSQNWNRFYDSNVGRYLESEPMLVETNYTAALLRLGHSLPAYGYAIGNPVIVSDANGLTITMHGSPESVAAANNFLTTFVNSSDTPAAIVNAIRWMELTTQARIDVWLDTTAGDLYQSLGLSRTNGSTDGSISDTWLSDKLGSGYGSCVKKQSQNDQTWIDLESALSHELGHDYSRTVDTLTGVEGNSASGTERSNATAVEWENAARWETIPLTLPGHGHR